MAYCWEFVESIIDKAPKKDYNYTLQLKNESRFPSVRMIVFPFE